jgi:hypothetical protein
MLSDGDIGPPHDGAQPGIDPATGLFVGTAGQSWLSLSPSPPSSTHLHTMRRDAALTSRRNHNASRRCPPGLSIGLVCTASALILLVSCLVSGCTTPTPGTSPTVESPPGSSPTLAPTFGEPTPHFVGTPSPVQPYVSPALGLAFSYPTDWVARATEKGVVLGTSEQVIAGGELASGAGLTIEIEPLPNAEWESFEDLALSRASVYGSEETRIGEPQPQAVGGETGAIVTVQGRPALFAMEVQGFVAATVHEQRAYILVGMSTAEEWSVHGPDLQAIVESVQFLPRELAQYTPDAWEPDDALAEATEIEPASPQTHDLHALGDRDSFRFQATRGHVYTIETLNLGPDVDTRIFLYDGDGHLLTHDDDGRALEENRASRLVWTAERTSTHYVMVHDVGDDDAGPGTSYDVRLWEEAHFVEDEYEPDDSPSVATVLKSGEPQPHNLHVAGDVDWMRLETIAGETYVFETFDLGEDVDTVLRLLDEEGNELWVDDDGRGEEEPRASRIRWTASSDARLYIIVHDAGEAAEGPGTQYWVRLQGGEQ